MNAHTIWATMLIMLSIFLNPLPSAEAAKLFFTINDDVNTQLSSADLVTCFDANGHYLSLDISGTYNVPGVSGKQIKIDPYDSSATDPTGTDQNYNKARIVCDESTDTISLKNAKITTPTPPVDYIKISFWRSFTAPPSGSSDYSVSGDGNFKRANNTGVVGANIQVRGLVDAQVLGGLSEPAPNPAVCSAQMTKCATTNPATWVFACASGFCLTDNVSSLSDPRVVKGEFWFKILTASPTDPVNISVAKGITVKSGPPQGPGDDCSGCVGTCPEGQFCQPPHWGCKWFGFFCPTKIPTIKQLPPPSLPPGPVPPGPLKGPSGS